MSASIAEANRAQCNQTGLVSFSNRGGCRASFDGSLCWGDARPGTTIRQLCPFKFCSDCGLPEEGRLATRHCQMNGIWSDPKYDQCVFIFFNTSCIEKTCRPCSDPFRQMIMNVTLTLSIVSVLLLLISITLFLFLKSIQCRRLTIHGNLALAFVLRFATYTVWILLQRDQILQGCGDALRRETGDWLCKFILFIIMYSTLASTFWMFVEGAYLVSRFSIYAMRATDGPVLLYLGVGWVAPLIFVIIWAAVLELQETVQFCWVPYTTTWALWLLVGPMSAALILNVLFLVVVIVVVIQKMRSARSTESAKIWQTIKSTLLLVPLLGVSNLLLFYEPSEKETTAFRIYLLTTAVMQHSQGIFVAILYCFGNGEVQQAVKREFEKLRLTRSPWRKESEGRKLTGGSLSGDAFLIRTMGVDADQNELKTGNRTNCEQCNPPRKMQFRVRGMGKITALCGGTGCDSIVKKRSRQETLPFISNNSPIIRHQYQSCVVQQERAPVVILTTPDGNFKYL